MCQSLREDHLRHRKEFSRPCRYIPNRKGSMCPSKTRARIFRATLLPNVPNWKPNGYKKTACTNCGTAWDITQQRERANCWYPNNRDESHRHRVKGLTHCVYASADVKFKRKQNEETEERLAVRGTDLPLTAQRKEPLLGQWQCSTH